METTIKEIVMVMAMAMQICYKIMVIITAIKIKVPTMETEMGAATIHITMETTMVMEILVIIMATEMAIVTSVIVILVEIFMIVKNHHFYGHKMQIVTLHPDTLTNHIMKNTHIIIILRIITTEITMAIITTMCYLQAIITETVIWEQEMVTVTEIAMPI